jgi:hypothetical protein
MKYAQAWEELKVWLNIAVNEVKWTDMDGQDVLDRMDELEGEYE